MHHQLGEEKDHIVVLLESEYIQVKMVSLNMNSLSGIYK